MSDIDKADAKLLDGFRHDIFVVIATIGERRIVADWHDNLGSARSIAARFEQAVIYRHDGKTWRVM